MGMLDGQVALIVGAAGGIGSAVVRRYLGEGCSVVAVDRDEERLNHLFKELGSNQSFYALVNGTLDWEGNKSLVSQVVKRFGKLDILVSCVGLHDHSVRLTDIAGEKLLDAFDEALRVNVGALLLIIRAALAELARNNGRIVVTGSFASYRTSGGGVLYTAAKHALVGLVSQLAFEFAPKVRINGVAPGVAATVMHGIGTLDQAPMFSVLPGTETALPLEKVPDASEFTGLYALLGSATETAAITGSMMLADSGLLVRGLAATNAGADL